MFNKNYNTNNTDIQLTTSKVLMKKITANHDVHNA